MPEINAADVKKLREVTGAGMMDCKKALAECKGDFDKGVDYLRTKGLADLAKRSTRPANEGIIEAYVHGGRIGVLVEVNCETDFVARNADFVAFAHDVAMQVAAARPHYVSRQDVPSGVVEHERVIYAEQAASTGKPEAVVAKIVDGKLEKFFEQTCLMEQPFVKDDSMSVERYLGSVVAKLGENIKVKRFVRYEIGERS